MVEEKKENLIAVRVDDKLLTRIDHYCTKNRMSKSLLIRFAIEIYLSLFEREEDDPEHLMIWGKKEMVELLKHLDEESIAKIAELSFNTSKEKYKEMLQSSKYREKQKKDKKPTSKEEKTLQCKKMWGFLKNLVLSNRGGFNWFNKIHESWNGPNLKIAGTHDLGLNFSLYIKYRTIFHMKPYDYVLINENLQENKLIMDFQQQ